MDEQTVKEGHVRDQFNAALPQVFNQKGLVKKNPNGRRATNRDFNRIVTRTTIMRNQIQNKDYSLVIELPCGEVTLNQEFSRMFATPRDDEHEQPDIILALLLQGWIVSAE